MKNKTMTNFLKAGSAAGIVIIALIIYFVLVNSKQAPKQDNSRKERVWQLTCVPIKDDSVRLEVDSYGTVRSGKTLSISSLVKGKIAEAINDLRNGLIVKKGQIIFKIDDTDYRHELDMVNSKIVQIKTEISDKELQIKNEKLLLESAATQNQLATKQLQRYQLLEKRNVISHEKMESEKIDAEEFKSDLISTGNKFDSNKIMLNNLKAKLKYAETQKEVAELNVDRCTIKSPIDGRVENLKFESGEYVTAGEVMLDIVDDNDLEIPISISIDDAANIFKFSEGTPDYSHWFSFAKTLPVKIEWNTNNIQTVWNGKIIGIEKYDKDTRTVVLLVKAEKKISGSTDHVPLVEGMFCKVSLFGRKINNAMRVPLSALQLDGYIYTVHKGRLVGYMAKVIQYGISTAVVSVKKINKGSSLVVQKLPQGIAKGAKVEMLKPFDSAKDGDM